MNERVRYVDRSMRLSSAQNPLVQARSPVAVTFVSPHPGFNLGEATKNARRVTNLQLLKNHIFGGNVAEMAARAELSPQRLNALLELDMVLSSELAEHIEQTLGLPGGWLDRKHERWTEELQQEVLQHMQSAAERARAQESVEAEAAAAATEAAAAESTTAQPDAAVQPIQADKVCESDDCEPRAPVDIVVSQDAQASAPSKERTMRAPYDLQWLNEQLNMMPRGAKSALAKELGRHVNDLSAWLNGHRPMPSPVRAQLPEALQRFNADLAQRFAQLKGEPQPGVRTAPEQEPAAAQPSSDSAASSTSSVRDLTSPRAVVKRTVGRSEYVTFRRQDAEELAQMAMITAQKLADVMQTALRMSAMHEQHEKAN